MHEHIVLLIEFKGSVFFSKENLVEKPLGTSKYMNGTRCKPLVLITVPDLVGTSSEALNKPKGSTSRPLA
jgi:hypothetical protein